MPVKIHAMPPSSGAVGPCILAAEAECGGLEMCNLMEGAHKTEAFTKLNAYQHIPTLEDGDFAIGESNAILRYIALKVVPFFWAGMCCEAKVPGLEVPARIKEYVNNFFGAVDAAKTNPNPSH